MRNGRPVSLGVEQFEQRCLLSTVLPKPNVVAIAPLGPKPPPPPPAPTLDSRVAALETQVAAIVSQNTVLANQVALLTNQVSALTSQVTALTTKADALDARVTVLEAKVAAQDARLAVLETTSAAQDSKIATLESKVSVIRLQLGYPVANTTIFVNQRSITPLGTMAISVGIPNRIFVRVENTGYNSIYLGHSDQVSPSNGYLLGALSTFVDDSSDEPWFAYNNSSDHASITVTQGMRNS